MTLKSCFSLTCFISIALFFLASCGITAARHEILGSGSNEQAVPGCERPEGMPQKYRLDNYRAPTPDCVPHGVTLNTHELKKLIQRSPEIVLIDVLSVMSRPDTEFGEHQWIPNKRRESLPGSVWLPNVGYGYLDDEMQQYFRVQLQELTQGDQHKPLVFFCIADCWMSWNAVQRAHEYGYTQLYWYKNGTDEWIEQGYESQEINPIPLTGSD